jgi:hypothetical protein
VAEPPEHRSNYQARDDQVADYEMYQLSGTGLWFRGPQLADSRPGSYFACIGAAQTFGCFCETPFPALLSQRLGLPALNLGYGGAGPEFFARQDSLFTYLNNAQFVVLQVMSGRSQSNSRFESRGLELLKRRSDGKSMGARQAYQELLNGPRAVRSLPLGRLSRRLAKMVAAPALRDLVAETQTRWVESCFRLLSRIQVPVILFWFSKRRPDYTPSLRNISALFGEFPQLVDAKMLAGVRPRCQGYVECVTDRGCPQPLFSRFTGEPVTVDPSNDRPDLKESEPWTHNRYYPTPQMHEDAASALLPLLLRLCDRTEPTR